MDNEQLADSAGTEELQGNVAPEGEELKSDEQPKTEKTFTQAELDKILARNHAKAERRSSKQIADLNRRIDELAQAGVKPAETGTNTPAAPKRGDYENYEDYLEARAEFKANDTLQKELTKLRAEQAEQTKGRQREDAETALKRQAEQRVKDGRKEYADFDSVIADAFEDGVIEQGSELYFGLIDSPMGHKLAYFLSKPENHAEAERLNDLTPRALQRELGKLELKLSATPDKETKKSGRQSMEPLEGRRHHNISDPMREDISTDDFIRIRNAQEFARRKG